MTKKRSYGEGTVLEWSGARSPDTKFRARRRVLLPTGKKKEVYGYGSTARKAVQDREAKIKVAITKAPSLKTITVRQLMAKWLTHKSKQQRKRSTLKTYSNFIRVHINPYIGDHEVSKVVPEDIQTIQYRLIDRGNYRTAQQVLMVTKCAFDYAQKLYSHDFELKNPATNIDRVSIPKVENPKDKPWTLEDLDKFLQLAKEYYYKGSTLYYPLYYTAFACGLRRGELLGLRWSEVLKNINADNSYRYSIKVITQRVYHDAEFYEDTPKTEASKREIPIASEHYDLLMEHKQLIDRLKETPEWCDDNLVFPSFSGRPIQPRNLRRSFNSLIKQLGLRPIKFHTLRKTYATYVTQNLLQQNKFPPKVLQKLLGHTRADVAMNIYAKVIDKDYLSATFTPTLKLESNQEQLSLKAKHDNSSNSDVDGNIILDEVI